jgi:hypothetical protein
MRNGTSYLLSAVLTGLLLVGCDESPAPTDPLADNRNAPPGASLNSPKIENDLSTDLSVSGSKIVADGIGLDGSTTGTISVDVPGGVTITRVLLYWEARGDDGDPSTVSVTVVATTKNITGEYIGLSTVPSGYNSRSYRADITTEFSFGTGTNTLTVDVSSGIDFNGASLVIVYDDGSDASIEIRDGDDFAFLPFPPGPNQFTELQTFTFPGAPGERQATLWLIVGDVEDSRPTKIEISVGGGVQELINVLGDGGPGRDGPEWDTYSTTVTIPAGVTELSVQVFSYDDGSDKVPASLAWVVAALTVPLPEHGGEGCTPGYWKQEHHFDSWTSPYEPGMHFSDVFEDAFSEMTLLQVLKQGGGGLIALGRHTVAALLNAASPDVSYDMSVSEVIDAFNDVYPGSKDDYNDVKDMFEDLNQLGCPLN